MKKIIIPKLLGSVIVILFLFTGVASGLERGAILYHSSKGDSIYGRDAALILPESIGQIAFRNMKSGHVGLYIGMENGKHRIIHAVAPAVEETDSNNFIPQTDLDEGCKYIGAKVPTNFSLWTQEKKDQLILLAKEQVGAKYDLLFSHQKGPYDEKFTCVGLMSTSSSKSAIISRRMAITREAPEASPTPRFITANSHFGGTGRV